MIILPAIDLFGKKAVRLYKGDYEQMTVYSEDPLSVALDFEKKGAKFIHLVDLEGAKDGTTPNSDIVANIVDKTNLFVEIGGGIRSEETLEKYFNIGVSRAILGTVAVTDESFLRNSVKRWGDKIAVGADVKAGYVAIKGWRENSSYTLDAFMEKMQSIGVSTVICTDISKDGAMCGTNRSLYKELSTKFHINIIASGGVSSLDDVLALRQMGLYGAIIGKAYYIGAIDLKKAIEVAE